MRHLRKTCKNTDENQQGRCCSKKWANPNIDFLKSQKERKEKTFDVNKKGGKEIHKETKDAKVELKG